MLALPSPQPLALPAPPPDVAAMLLADKRSPETRRAYAADLRGFFGGLPTPDLVSVFLRLPRGEIAMAVTGYKAAQLAAGLSEATVNRRLAAIKSLLKLAHRLGLCETDGRGVCDGERVQAYRDTRGVDLKTMRKLLALPAKLHRDPARVTRDTALLTLLCENALRRREICRLDVNDFEPATLRLFVLGKGKGSQRLPVTLSPSCSATIVAYLAASPSDGPLFRNIERRATAGERLTPDGLYYLTQCYGRAAGLSRLTPHMLRHSCLTAALNMTNGDVRRVQALSRHANVGTLMKYDDNRSDFGGQLSNDLSRLLGAR